ncbi:Cupredoxin [Mycena rosella]|uniref:Cupredoxin n=1 Tax=Mycena rosella TaxID=1033263 RepID=A0AAD7GH60_MYCRO|nr:Cupredoxin [Mycena rosella]
MQFLLALPALLAALNAHTALAASVIRDYTLDIVNGPVSPDGFTRIGVLANGTFPGPVLTANKGDTLRVLTDGSMRLSTTIDFDGVFIDTDNIYNEGSPFVTTCPFGPNTSYTYELPLGSLLLQLSAYSQLSVQYADGLRGPVIIYDPEDPQADLYDVDDESTILTVADWWHNTSTSGLASYMATQIIPVSDSGLFNGAGRFQGGPLTPYAAVSVTPRTRYRFRLINMSARSSFTVSIDNHTLTVIETDGVATVPIEVDVITLHAGQRYSFVLTANQPVANYWINAILSGGNPSHNANLNATLGRGILRYEGAPDAEPTTPITNGPPDPGPGALAESNLRAPTPDFNLTFLTFMAVNRTVWEINNVSYIPPHVPTLVKILKDGASTEADFNKSENTFVFPANKVIQVTFPPDPTDELHPFHLHGNNFWVVKSNDSDVINTVNPIRRDVSAMGNGGTILRFTTDKPGPWFFHCHIFYHFAAGLGSVILGGPDQTRQQVHPPSAWEGLCPAYDALPPALQ